MNIFEYYKDIFLESINYKNIDKNIKKKIAVEIPKQKIEFFSKNLRNA